MKVWKRILIKLIILLLVIGAAGGGAVGLQGYRQSTPEYTAQQYLNSLIDNQAEEAYAMLDQSEDTPMTQEQYAGVLTEKQYSLYSGYNVQAGETRHDDSGNEYVDYHVEFLDAANEVQAEDDITVKKQSDLFMGIFDQWRVMSSHCMVKDFQLTVPAGSQVYLDGVLADSAWMNAEEGSSSVDCYEIPTLIPGQISLAVRHPVLESVNTTLDALEQSADYSESMALKESAQDECLEIGVTVLREIYSAAAAGETAESEDLFADCQEAAEEIAAAQSQSFHRESSDFRTAGISGFTAEFGELTFTDGENGAIEMEMTFRYHYVVREDVTTDSEELQEDGTPVQITETVSDSGDNTAKLQMSYYDGAWHVAALEIPVIPQ